MPRGARALAHAADLCELCGNAASGGPHTHSHTPHRKFFLLWCFYDIKDKRLWSVHCGCLNKLLSQQNNNNNLIYTAKACPCANSTFCFFWLLFYARGARPRVDGSFASLVQPNPAPERCTWRRRLAGRHDAPRQVPRLVHMQLPVVAARGRHVGDGLPPAVVAGVVGPPLARGRRCAARDWLLCGWRTVTFGRPKPS
jgi:hypothetical protein